MKVIASKFDADTQGRDARPCSQRQALKKGSARAMTIKERLKVHAEIERENARKLRDWKEGEKRND